MRILWIMPLLAMLVFVDIASAGSYGTDQDGDGIWDDVNRYINIIHHEDSPARKATVQMVKAMQNFVTDSYSESQTKLNGHQLKESLECLFYCNQLQAPQIYQTLRKIMLSDDKREVAFNRAEEIMLGEKMRVDIDPEKWQASCKFPTPNYNLNQSRSFGKEAI
jgi:hypothetical protein